mmetsp:Transcript_14444/g.14241  ORF Transcript_14444/g.14241 Transcript_14444/m.14241 type:complete len:90 (-) Transcript_14444:10-279(-)
MRENMLRSWWNRFIKESTINNNDDKSNNVGKGSPRSSVRSTKDSSPQQAPNSDDKGVIEAPSLEDAAFGCRSSVHTSRRITSHYRPVDC